MPFGYNGRILHVDLSAGSLDIEMPDESFYRTYIGGSALGAYYLHKLDPIGVDPFSPDSTLVFSLSVCTGAPISGQSRLTTTAKSPLTGTIGDAQSGGFFPAEMKFSGFDAVVFRGRADNPVYLWIHDGEAELHSAAHIWGKVTGEVEDILRSDLGDEKIEIAQCGPAGEELVRYAGVINMANRANGRTGMGAVMGSKNLKAIVVRGRKSLAFSDRERLLELAKWGAENIEDSGIFTLAELGTAGSVVPQDKTGGLPTRNWSSGTFEGAENLDGKRLYNTILKERHTCFACTVRCKRVVEVTEGPFIVNPRYGGPEYETLATFGSYCGVDDIAAVSLANQLCNMYGMDTISCGATIAWAMDCFESGIIDEEDTGGLELIFGNARAMVELTEMIGQREGIGDLLAEGSARAAEQFGPDAEALVVAAKKQEFPAHMPQVKRSLALMYAVNPFGADHMSHEHDPTYREYPDRMAKLGLRNPQPDEVLNEEKVRFTLKTQFIYSALDTFNLCQFVFGPAWQLYDLDQTVTAVQAITGWDVNLEELQRIGERRLNLLRAYNVREGVTRDADVLPKKVEKALVGGKSDGIAISPDEIESAKDHYYEMAGWTVESGVPTPEKLESLDLGWIEL